MKTGLPIVDTAIDIWRVTMSLKDMKALRRKLAKRANQRLVRLERAFSEVTGEKFSSYGAAQIAYDYLNKEEGGRFSESLNHLNEVNQLRREITVLQNFLTAQSSTVKGQKAIEIKRMKTFESGKWGSVYRRTGKLAPKLKFASNKEFYDFLNSDTFHGLLKAGFTSEQIMELYDQAYSQMDDDEIWEKMQEALDTFREKGNATLKGLKEKFGFSDPLR